MSGTDLDVLFDVWLFTPSRPDLGAAALRAPAEPRSWQSIHQGHRDLHR